MSFGFYKNALSQATRGVATMIFVTGLVLIGFGFLIYLLPRFFATLAAIVFFVVGIVLCSTAVKIFLAQRKSDETDLDNSEPYRKNVRIRIEEHYDV